MTPRTRTITKRNIETASVNNNVVNCPRCNNSNPIDSRYCNNCGFRIDNNITGTQDNLVVRQQPILLLPLLPAERSKEQDMGMN